MHRGTGQVLVRTEVSAISPGTEMLIYRGDFAGDLAIDETIDSLAGRLAYPMRYGYSAVGRVIALDPALTLPGMASLFFLSAARQPFHSFN